LVPQLLFEEEMYTFLAPFNGEKKEEFDSHFPCPTLFFSERRLLLHLISLEKAPTFSSITFAQLIDLYAAQDIKVIHVWEDVWHTKKQVVQSRLRALLGTSQRIPARLTKVRRIDKPTMEAFIDKNHLQVSTQAKFKYGLFLPKNYQRILKEDLPATSLLAHQMETHQEALVAVATFSGGKNIIRGGETYRSFELIRFANFLDCTVVGGVDKLLKAFVTELQPDDLMTYADRDWSDGKSYEQLGFERLGITPPQTFWVNLTTWERHYYDRLPTENNTTDWVKVYNSGNWKFLKKWK